MSSTTNVTVNVGDVQDTPPRFIGNLTSEVLESAPINTLVMKIHAEDGDRGVPRKIVYELVNSKLTRTCSSTVSVTDHFRSNGLLPPGSSYWRAANCHPLKQRGYRQP